ncbi:hypothetical protein CDAR_77141 [Caerostris darwini]|uniref:Uncharacterized protein n=1 Tax=Caerostris darwini TaxID=1538125 RepID=A0AAV4SK17_9ARAC|nr:hypothetical protein CDAR_77141 [Caerostris darwini]
MEVEVAASTSTTLELVSENFPRKRFRLPRDLSRTSCVIIRCGGWKSKGCLCMGLNVKFPTRQSHKSSYCHEKTETFQFRGFWKHSVVLPSSIPFAINFALNQIPFKCAIRNKNETDGFPNYRVSFSQSNLILGDKSQGFAGKTLSWRAV